MLPFFFSDLADSGRRNVHGYSDMAIQTRTTKLVIEFKRIRKGGSQKAAMKKALDQLISLELMIME
ncbi:PD-(D/E)XK nuclease domain-containing protein [Succinimonas sp.]|uniref:PD-(D/E)XK nuclease domain-containing protein n=1 Tax=Succinimonas sp. TaxID=1936151 RepID=UPI00386349F1